MKALYLTLLFIFVFALVYFILSAFGVLFGYSYKAVIGNVYWFYIYTILIGWVPAVLVTMEEYKRIY